LWDFVRFAVAEHDALDSQLQNEVRQQTNLQIRGLQELTTIRHGVTKYRITLRCVFSSEVSGKTNGKAEFKWVRRSELSEMPLSVTGRKICQLL
jgi:A/G-specific adenine glycosylase